MDGMSDVVLALCMECCFLGLDDVQNRRIGTVGMMQIL